MTASENVHKLLLNIDLVTINNMVSYIKRAFLRMKRSTADMLEKTWFIIMKKKAPDLKRVNMIKL